MKYTVLLQSLIDFAVNRFQSAYTRKFALPHRSIESICSRESDVCHIVGSGASSAITVPLGDDDELWMTANISAGLRTNWDVVFIEYDGDPAYKARQQLAIQNCSIQTLVLKNNYPHRMIRNPREYQTPTVSSCLVLSESNYIGPSCSYHKYFMQTLDRENFVFTQFASTLFTMLRAVLESQPTIIVLHGIDFGGPNFYELTEYAHLKPSVASHVSRKGRAASRDVKQVLNCVSHELATEKGLKIISAIEYYGVRR